MPDAQCALSGEAAASAQPSRQRWFRSPASCAGLVLVVATGILWMQPGLRAQVLDLRASLSASALSSLIAEEAEAIARAAEPEPVPLAYASENHTVSFLASMGDKQPARQLAQVKTSEVQIESLGRYITRKYRVSGDATRMLVSTAYSVGEEMGLDPLLLLAVMAIESRFNPFAESHVGAQGLMQVLTRVHIDKFESFGGRQAAWNPVANIRVGAQILKDCIARGGSVVGGLRMYVGAAFDSNHPYSDKVLAERQRLASAAGTVIDVPARPAVRSAGRSPAAAPAAEAEATQAVASAVM